MCYLFSLNFAGPSYFSIKRDGQKGVQFVGDEHNEVFMTSIRAVPMVGGRTGAWAGHCEGGNQERGVLRPRLPTVEHWPSRGRG